jgi:nitroimidazol reductase NimA-like FMN-containing flavoprotein (pyridoxamine 5'-phosphate oxidase superfamily)
MKRNYPQALPFAEGDLEAFLERPLIAKLCTHNPDGTIHIAPLYFRYEAGEMFLGTQDISRKVKNIKHNNNVTVLVDAEDPVMKGVIMVGEADLDYDDVIAKRAAIFKKYMGDPEGAAKRIAAKWKPVIIHFKPHSVITFDYSQ